ncbi:MAG: hypothetical protein IJT42_09810, partial [Treponema sp.]|nr:hypothetical protein [Treponema sp.]
GIFLSCGLSCARAWSCAGGGHWTERPPGSEGSGWSASGIAERPTREAGSAQQNCYLLTANS